MKKFISILLLCAMLLLIGGCKANNAVKYSNNISKINEEVPFPEAEYDALAQLRPRMTRAAFEDALVAAGAERYYSAAQLHFSCSEFSFSNGVRLRAHLYHPDHPDATDPELSAMMRTGEIEYGDFVIDNIYLTSKSGKEYDLFKIFS